MTPSTPKRRRCVVCNRRDPVATLCRPCLKSLDATTAKDGTLLAVIEWAAKRARYSSGRGRSWRRSKSERREETAAIRDACYRRAGGVCECGCGRPVHHDAAGLGIDFDAQAELDHVFSKGKGARLPQSVETCWILRADCHRDRTNNRPDAVTWWEKFIAHCTRHGIAYDQARHAAVKRLRFVAVRRSLPAAPRSDGPMDSSTRRG